VVVVSDIRMGMIDGLDVLKAARNQSYRPAVILLTGYGSLDTAIAALRTGASDYLLKPCDPALLVDTVTHAIQQRLDELNQADAMDVILQIAERMQAKKSTPGTRLTNPANGQSQPVEQERYMRVGALSIDYFRHKVSFEGKPLHMTRIEYDLVRCLAEAQGRVLTYGEIVRHTHGQKMDNSEALLLLKQHIRNIRSKIPSDYLVNVRSTGYMLVDPDEPEEPA
jgi:DNA-binding response OmpR family regulator